MEQNKLNDNTLEDVNQNLIEMNETEDLPTTGQKRSLIEEESDEGWKIVDNRGKGKKSRLNSPEKEIPKLEVTISCSEKLPKSFALAKMLKINEIYNIIHVKYLSPFRVRIQFQDESSMDKLCLCEEFIAKRWRFSKDMEVSYSYGVIKDVELELKEKEILSSLFCKDNIEIISVKRLDRRNQEGGWSPCEVVRICFKGNSLPPYVYTDGLRLKVEPYIYPVSQCSRCWKLGHRLRTCPSNKIICPKCGGDHANCETKIFKCINCSGNHMALSKTCPLYLKERRIREIMAEFNCSYKRALTAYVPPSPHVNGQNKRTEENNPIVYVSSFENTPTFAEVVTVEAEVHVEDPSSPANLCNKTPINKKKSFKMKQKLPEFLLEWQSSLAEESQSDEDHVYEQNGSKQTKGPSAKKSTSFETLVIQNITNVNELKAKLNDIIKTGKDYEYDVSSCIKSLIISSDQDIVQLSIEAIAELVKCEEKRETYAHEDIIGPILVILRKETTSDNVELVRQCCRALGNLCCDCDTARRTIIAQGGIPVLIKLLERSIDMRFEEIQMLSSKSLLNFAIGGAEFTEAIFQGGVVDLVQRMLCIELMKHEFDDDTVSTCLLILSVINDNTPELLYNEIVNKTVLQVLRETSTVEISEVCLDHLHSQAEHETVKTLIAKEGGVQLVCSRLEQLVNRHNAGELNVDDSEVEAIMKQACELVIIVLTGDEAMHILYNNGVGDVYQTVVKWLDSQNYQLLTTAVLAIGNFARQDDYCTQMMHDKIFDKLLDIFEIYNSFSLQMQREPEKMHPIDAVTVIKVQHAVLSSLRNLAVPVSNKRVAAAQGRAAPILLNALPTTEDHHVAYKLLATIRLLVDGQEGVAKLLASNSAALCTIAKWGHAAEFAGAAGEAPRLLAWSVKQLRHHYHWRHIVEVEGCISSLVNMLVASHSLMQNEAILALTLLAIESLKKLSPDSQQEYDYEKNFVAQLIKSEIGKHVTILVDTNCAKMPIEVAENLLAFLDITSKNNQVAFDYKEAKVHECLMKFSDSRNDLTSDMKACIYGVFSSISNNGKSD